MAGGEGFSHGGVVGVAFFAVAVEGLGVRGVEVGVCGEALYEVGVGDEELAEEDRVGFALGEEVVSGLFGELFVGDEGATKDFLEAWAEGVGALVLAGGDKGEFALAELAGEVLKGGGRVGVSGRLGVTAGGRGACRRGPVPRRWLRRR